MINNFKNSINDIDFVGKNANQLLLWTKRGASRHCKILDTDEAWDQFDALAENYFRGEVQPQPQYPIVREDETERNLVSAIKSHSEFMLPTVGMLL